MWFSGIYTVVAQNDKMRNVAHLTPLCPMPRLWKGYSHKNKQSCSPVHVCKHKTSTTDKGTDCRSTPLANQRGGYERRVHNKQNDLQAKRMSLFIASFIRPQATSVTSCQTRFYSQLVDFSAAINSVDPRRLWFGGPRWLWRKPTDVGRRDVKPRLVDIKGSGGLLQKNHCVWVDFLHCMFGGPPWIPWEMMTDWFISPRIKEHLLLLDIRPIK